MVEKEQLETPDKKHKKRRPWFLIKAGILICIVLYGLRVYFFFLQKNATVHIEATKPLARGSPLTLSNDSLPRELLAAHGIHPDKFQLKVARKAKAKTAIEEVVPAIRPQNVVTSSGAKQFISNYLEQAQQTHKREKPLLVFYNLESCETNVFVVLTGSFDMCVNNIKIFASTITNQSVGHNEHTSSLERPPVLYIFIGTKKAATSLIPLNLPNVLFIKEEGGELTDFHLRAVPKLGTNLLQKFETIYFTSEKMRGPFKMKSNEDWLFEYRDLMNKHHIGLMGNTLTCETPTPSVQLDAFAIKGSAIDLLVTAFNSNNIEVQLSEEMRRAKYNISSYLYYVKARKPVFDGTCMKSTRYHPYEPTVLVNNPTYWCMLPDEMLFLTWRMAGTGAMMNMVCEEVETDMRNYLLQLAVDQPELQLLVPEARSTGAYLYSRQDYEREIWVDTLTRSDTAASKSMIAQRELSNKTQVMKSKHKGRKNMVCFVVQTDHIIEKSEAKGVLDDKHIHFINYDITSFVSSMRRQTNFQWKAFFYPTGHDLVLKKGLYDFVHSANDSRLVFLHIDEEQGYLIDESHNDRVHRMGDMALRNVLGHRECKWVSVTNADNVYGSETVDRVINVRPDSFTGKIPDMVLAPLDSLKFRIQDTQFRAGNSGKPTTESSYCKSFFANYRNNLLAFTKQSTPHSMDVDLTAVFFERKKLFQENLFVGNFSKVSTKDPSSGGSDGYIAHFLIMHRLWTYTRLAIDGLKSVIFSSPSPSLCAAAGNVWLDIPPTVSSLESFNQQSRIPFDFQLTDLRSGCLDIKQAYRLLFKARDRVRAGNINNDIFDFAYFQQIGEQCIRLNKNGFELHAVQVNAEETKKVQDRIDSINISQFDSKAYLHYSVELSALGVNTPELAYKHFNEFGAKEGRGFRFPNTDEQKLFGVQSYMELNRDYVNDKILASNVEREEAWAHYHSRPGRLYSWSYLQTNPLTYDQGFAAAKAKILKWLVRADGGTVAGEYVPEIRKRIQSFRRNLVICHIGPYKHHIGGFKEMFDDSLDVYINNLRILTGAILSMTEDSHHQAFFIFNVIGPENALERLIPIQSDRVAIIKHNVSGSDLGMHFRTVDNIGEQITSQFSAVLFSNQGVRGPLIDQEDGKWLGRFRHLLDQNNVAIVGPSLSCEVSPHVQTHMFMLRTSVLPILQNKLFNSKSTAAGDWLGFIATFEVGLTTLLITEGYNISSLLYYQKAGDMYFNGTCLPYKRVNPNELSAMLLNPVSWCHYNPEDLVFQKWGGESMKTLGYLCDAVKEQMKNSLVKMTSDKPSLDLIVPEIHKGGKLYDMHREWLEEFFREKIPVVNQRSNRTERDKKVCFLVRTASMHDPLHDTNVYTLLDSQHILHLVESLLRQNNPNWAAFFFPTDQVPFRKRLNEILGKFNDKRLVQVDVLQEYLPPFSSIDAGYTATDFVLKLLFDREECEWLTVTNADNVYGTEVIDRVLNTKPNSFTGDMPDMVLAPLDSRNFDNQYSISRDEFGEWHYPCGNIVANTNFNLLAAAIQPLPMIGRVDLASVFFKKEKWKSENVLFSNFTADHRICRGCQDGMLAQYLVEIRFWKFQRLAIDGIKSIVMHGPSPTRCIASGMVWLDHPMVNSVGCLTQEAVRLIRLVDLHKSQQMLDWANFDRNDNRMCLRFSLGGYEKHKHKDFAQFFGDKKINIKDFLENRARHYVLNNKSKKQKKKGSQNPRRQKKGSDMTLSE